MSQAESGGCARDVGQAQQKSDLPIFAKSGSPCDIAHKQPHIQPLPLQSLWFEVATSIGYRMTTSNLQYYLGWPAAGGVEGVIQHDQNLQGTQRCKLTQPQQAQLGRQPPQVNLVQ